MRHIISADINCDNLTGECKGNGRIKVRLSEGETHETVINNLSKAGIWVSEHIENPNKNSKFSVPVKEVNLVNNKDAFERYGNQNPRSSKQTYAW